MTIDKSWTTIANRNHDDFLYGLFAFKEDCKKYLHPITQKIRCPCRRCCNCEILVTLDTLEAHISQYGFDEYYTTWIFHGEPVLPLLPPLLEKAKEHVPPAGRLWGTRTPEEWAELVDWFSQPNNVKKSEVNKVNRLKNTIKTHQGKKSLSQGRHEFKLDHGYYEDLIESWRRYHADHDGIWKEKENKKRYDAMRKLQQQVRGGVIPPMTDQEILDHVMQSTNRQNMSGMGRLLPGGGSTSNRRGPPAPPTDYARQGQVQQVWNYVGQQQEWMKAQLQEAVQRAYMAGLQASSQNAPGQNAATVEFFQPSSSSAPPMPPMPHFPYAGGPFQTPFLGTFPPSFGPFQPPFPNQLQPLQPSFPVTNNNFNNCYRPVLNTTNGEGSSSRSQPESTRYISNPHENDTRGVDQLRRDRDLELRDQEDDTEDDGDFSRSEDEDVRSEDEDGDDQGNDDGEDQDND